MFLCGVRRYSPCIEQHLLVVTEGWESMGGTGKGRGAKKHALAISSSYPLPQTAIICHYLQYSLEWMAAADGNSVQRKSDLRGKMGTGEKRLGVPLCTDPSLYLSGSSIPLCYISQPASPCIHQSAAKISVTGKMPPKNLTCTGISILSSLLPEWQSPPSFPSLAWAALFMENKSN